MSLHIITFHCLGVMSQVFGMDCSISYSSAPNLGVDSLTVMNFLRICGKTAQVKAKVLIIRANSQAKTKSIWQTKAVCNPYENIILKGRSHIVDCLSIHFHSYLRLTQ